MPSGSRVVFNNPIILKWAREELGLSIPEIAQRFHKPKSTIEAWENGGDGPTYRQLKDLANYYKRPIATFFLPKTPPKTPKPQDFRSLPDRALGFYSKDTLLAYREMHNMLTETRDLLDEFELNISFSIPHWEMGDPPEPKADQLRKLLGISVENQIKDFTTHHIALDEWRSALFNFGVIVRICDMPITDARAFCLFGSKLAGIGISNEDREHGRIFSLFHEVCHLALQQPGVSGISSYSDSPDRRIEQYCDRFAASFLLPATHPEVMKSLDLFEGTFDYLELARYLARRYKVSKYVVLRRALDLGKIETNIYWQLVEEWKQLDAEYVARTRSKSTGGPDYNVTQIHYMGKRFISLVMRALQTNYLTPVQAKRILGIDATAVEINM